MGQVIFKAVVDDRGIAAATESDTANLFNISQCRTAEPLPDSMSVARSSPWLSLTIVARGWHRVRRHQSFQRFTLQARGTTLDRSINFQPCYRLGCFG